jgi:protein-disulfide isomerase
MAAAQRRHEMNRRVDQMNRRSLLAGAAAAAAFAATGGRAVAQGVLNIFEDPEAPTAGNPAGDVTIKAFFDYNCSYCKESEADLDRVMRDDGKIRLVYKDLPILSEASGYAAQAALGARYQGKYDLVHRALMALPGKKIPWETMLEAVVKSGVDMDRLRADMQAHNPDIVALLRRNIIYAQTIGIQGTPTYLIGPVRATTLDYAGFKEKIAEARQRQAEAEAETKAK